MYETEMRLAAAALLLVGCFDPTYSDATRCGADGSCPSGRSCVQGMCRVGGSAIDAPLLENGDGGMFVTLTKSGAGAGGVEVTSPAIAICDPACSGFMFPTGSGPITLRATPASGSYFAGWTGPCSGILRDCTFDYSLAAVVDARFETKHGNFMFLSSETTAGDFGGVANADATCGRLAGAVGLDGTWMALLSQSTSSVRSRLLASNARGFLRMDGQAVADTVTDLLDNHATWYPIRFDETGRDAVEASYWTGSNSDGTTADSGTLCSSWSSKNLEGQTGGPAGGPLLSHFLEPCAAKHPFLCAEVDRYFEGNTPTVASGAKIWITKGSFDTTAGIGAADMLCQNDRPLGVSTARALLATTTQRPSDVLLPGRSYVRVDGVPIGTGQDIIDGKQLSAPRVQSDGTFTSAITVWTGSTGVNSVARTGDESCDNWLATPGSMGTFGVPSISASWWGGPATSCFAPAPVLCVEQ
jgi:hypothetical protein